MITSKILTGALVAAVTATAAPAFAANFDVNPASFAEGIVTGVNADAGTLTIGQQTYTLKNRLDLLQVRSGDEAEVTYVLEDGKVVVLAVRPLERDNPIELVD